METNITLLSITQKQQIIEEKKRLRFVGSRYLSMDKKITSAPRKLSPCDVEALKKCLEENKGDQLKCQSQIEAFKSSCSLKKPPSSKST
ncbi:hypothetical protein J5N97_023055 [Dioscorea zingiberensis]|uniref:Uncharacterized protein n=1 Tax=Dioscorea zingiberensis TaxID=325984 RepID=A0A9D5CCA5_9LILI|nr:hypothetical protein J5N97_023055 [Dioscorea zingiberensis]